MLDVYARSFSERWVRPTAGWLGRHGISPNAITAAGIVTSALSGAAILEARLRLGLALLVLTGVLDLLDGAVARSLNAPTRRGAFLDSVSDRVTEIFVFGGLAGQQLIAGSSLGAGLAVGALVVGMQVSYIRARAQSLGADARASIAGRGERLVGLGVALVFPAYTRPILAALVVLSTITVFQRVAEGWRRLGEPERPTDRAGEP